MHLYCYGGAMHCLIRLRHILFYVGSATHLYCYARLALAEPMDGKQSDEYASAYAHQQQ